MSASIPQKPVHLINNNTALADCIRELRSHAALAVDLEFDSHSFAYGVTLALIQVATPAQCYLIDPFAKIDLTLVYDVFNDGAVQKIVHSPGEDLRLLHSLGCQPQNVFDTELVARLLNYEFTSLSVLLQDKLGIAMSKKQQRSNWLLRPLTDEQITYAAADVTSLHALKALLGAEAAEKGLMPFIVDEQEALSKTTYMLTQKTNFLKPADSYSMSPYDQYVLNALLAYRDEISRSMNKPAYKVMEEDLMRQLAAGNLQPHQLHDAKGLHPSLRHNGFAKQVELKMDEIEAKATEAGLSALLPLRKRLTADERIAKDKAEQDKKKVFEPIQAMLAARFGTFAARYILSNSAVNDLLEGHQKISDLRQTYRKELIKNIAGEAGVDLGNY